MPDRDGTGPLGNGAMTGDGHGKCIIPLNTQKEEMTFLKNQKNVLREHLEQVETRINLLEGTDRKRQNTKEK